MLDLDAIQARADAAKPGAWHYYVGDAEYLSEVPWWFKDGTGLEILGRLTPPDDRDAEFIAHARADVLAMAAELLVARKVIKAADSYRAFLPMGVVERLDDYELIADA